MRAFIGAVLALAACGGGVAGPAAGEGNPGAPRTVVTRAEDLPVHTYAVPSPAVRVIREDAEFAKLAAALRADLEADLERYDIRDRTTVKNFTWTLAVLDLLEGKYESALRRVERVKALEDKPAARIVNGEILRALIAAKGAPAATFIETFRQRLSSRVATWPYPVVRETVKGQIAGAELLSRNLIEGAIQATIEPAAKSGRISGDMAAELVFHRLVDVELLAVNPTVVAVLRGFLARNQRQAPDIWAAREVSLAGASGLTPVVLGIWDSGTDPSLYRDQLWVNAKEVADNGRDDDRNGYIDDRHGIAHDAQGRKASGMLLPLVGTPAQIAEVKQFDKGFVDLIAQVDSPEATALKKKLASLKPDEAQRFFDDLRMMGAYSHGTHVAGIALRGNPAARLLTARLEFDLRTVPAPWTPELAAAFARSFTQTVAYFKKAGVRVVNMSWGFTRGELERSLEVNNTGGTPAERKALARRMFDTMAAALKNAIAGAPDILFVAAAGNADSDARFAEVVPSAFVLPNLIITGAVDQAGDETAFTSFGTPHLHANGYEVESLVPGGEKQKLSGTSMSSPQVVNLAGKLLARHPTLTVKELRQALLDGADEKAVSGDRTIRLLNPKRSVDIVEQR